MKWLRWRRPAPVSDEADEALTQVRRARVDARNFDRRADAVEKVSRQIQRRNHIAEAVEFAIRPHRRAE